MEQYNGEYDYGDSPIYTGDDHLMPQQTVQNAMQVNMMGYQQLARVSNPQIVFTPMHPQIITPGLSALPVMGTMANIVHVQQPQQMMQQHQIQGFAQPVFQHAQALPIMQTANVSMLPAGTSLIPIHQNGQLMSGNTQIDQIIAETKEPVKSKPKPAKKAVKSTNSGLSSMQMAIQSQGSQYKELRDFVARILERQTNHGYASEFTERALLNLAKKVTAIQLSMLNDWENAINTGDPSIGCVVVPRPKDGRMTVTKTYGGHNTKKVFPQILVCQIFRWPQIVFRHDIRSVESCQHKSIIKSANSSFNSEDVPMDDLECSSGGDVICINPFHFYLTNEAKARIQKSQNKAMKSQSQQVESLQQQEPIPNVFFHQQQFAQTAEQHLPQVQEQPFSQIQNLDIHEQASMSSIITLDPDPESSGDESESSDEVVSVNSDDTVDYVKMWQDQAEHPDYGTAMTKNLTIDDVLGELKLYKYKEESKQLDKLSPDTFSKLKIKESIFNSILSGKLARKAMRRANIKLEDEETSEEEEEDDVSVLNQSGFDGPPSLFEFDDLEESTHVPMEKVLKKGPPLTGHRLQQGRGLLMGHRNEMARLESDAMQHMAGPSHSRDFLKRDTILDSFTPQSFTAQVIPGSSLLLNSSSSKSQFSHVTVRDDDNSLDNLLASIQGSYQEQFGSNIVSGQSTTSGAFFDPDDDDDDLPVADIPNIVGSLGDEVFDPMVDF